MNEGTEFRYRKLKILIDDLISDPIHLSIDCGIKRDFHAIESKIQHSLHRRLAFSYHKLPYDLFNTRYNMLIELGLYAKIIEEVLGSLEGSYGELDYHETGGLD